LISSTLTSRACGLSPCGYSTGSRQKLLDQFTGQWRHFQHPATPVRPLAILATHIEAAHLGRIEVTT
jgi:hypothetical protein